MDIRSRVRVYLCYFMNVKKKEKKNKENLLKGGDYFAINVAIVCR